MTPNNYHPPYQGGRVHQQQQNLGSYGYGGSYGSVPAYGVTNPSGRTNGSRTFFIVLGWIVAFVWPIAGAALNYLVQGLDFMGIMIVSFMLGPVFFTFQAILNICYLALPKEGGISTFHLWVGHAIWWGGSLLLAAMIRTPGGFGNNIEAVDRFFSSAEFLDNLWSMMIIWGAVATVGYLWTIAGIVFAVRDGDNKRKYAYRQNNWGRM